MFFFFNDTATTEIYTLSLPTLFRSQAGEPGVESGEHRRAPSRRRGRGRHRRRRHRGPGMATTSRSEEHTSELQSRLHIGCRLPREKKNRTAKTVGAHIEHFSWFAYS